MKWFVCGGAGVILSIIMIYFSFAGSVKPNEEYLRIHVRANSNTQFDQEVKYFVKDVLVEALSDIIKDADTKQEAMDIISKNMKFIVEVANAALQTKGVNYTSKASICEEDFPTRAYDNLTLPAGKYDALIVSLGSGEGDNWWCLVYPAFCFKDIKKDVHYTSKLWQIINSIKK